MASAMDVDEEEVEMASCSSSKGDKKRFEVKKVIRSIIIVFLFSLCHFCWLSPINNVFFFNFSGMPLHYGLGVCKIRKIVKYFWMSFI